MARSALTLLASVCALVTAASCVRPSASAVQVAPAPAPQPAIAETPPPEPPASPPAASSIPAHGLASLALACELIVKVGDSGHSAPEYVCDPKDGIFDEQARAGLLTASGWVNYDLPVIASAAGWSVFPPVLSTWDTGNEINQARAVVSFQSWTSQTYGELVVIDIEAAATQYHGDWDLEERHWRTVICAPDGATPRCTSAILHRIEQAKLRGDSRRTVSSYRAKLSLDGDELVVQAREPPRNWLTWDGMSDFLKPGRHSLAQLFADGEQVWKP